jgi:phytoene/squalene synthetase
MATATKKEIAKTEVTLVLNGDEAQFLADIMGRIGGDSQHSRRRHADAIARALGIVNFHSSGGNDVEPSCSTSGVIYFKDDCQ